jgi:hypothetical protein
MTLLFLCRLPAWFRHSTKIPPRPFRGVFFLVVKLAGINGGVFRTDSLFPELISKSGNGRALVKNDFVVPRVG